MDCQQTSQDFPLVVPFQSCSTNSIPSRILVAMATKRKKFTALVKNYWSDFKIIWYKIMVLGRPSTKVVQDMAARGRGQLFLSCKGDKSCKCGCLVIEFFPLIVGRFLRRFLCILMDLSCKMCFSAMRLYSNL